MHDHEHQKYLEIYIQNNPLEKICEFNTSWALRPIYTNQLYLYILAMNS